MNLIEKLGGYAQAKNWLDKNEIHVKHGYLEKYRAELLEYRRQHNIYEFGDICKLKIKHDFGLYKFRRIEGDRACLEDRLGFAEFWINKDVVEHANDAEIQAGKRL